MSLVLWGSILNRPFKLFLAILGALFATLLWKLLQMLPPGTVVDRFAASSAMRGRRALLGEISGL